MGSTLGIQEASDKFNSKDTSAAIENIASDTIQAIDETTESYKERIAEKLGEVKFKVSENLSGAAEKVHEKSDAAQDFLFDKTDKVNSYAHQTIEKANHLGHRAADALDASSGYVKNFDLAETRQQVMETIKQRPEVSIAVAGVFGLLIGLLIGRSTRN
jgi:ElaB/YqjD/DUF883 family membrane-anchored ribosome-binding protein